MKVRTTVLPRQSVTSRLIMLCATVILTCLTSSFANAESIKRRLCVWDIMGQNGEIFARLKDYQVKASTLGVDFDLKGYVDERVASEDFRVRYCDAVVMTGLRVRPFNAFTGSIEAVGAIPSYEHMRTLVSVLSSPTAAHYMKTNFDGQAYEVIGIMPFGAAYGFVNDRRIDSPERLPNKKIAIFDYDKAQAKLVRDLGAQSDPSDLTNFAGKFNNGKVDIVVVPATAYRPLELYRGLGQNGGIVDYVLAQVSLQIVVHADRFPADFGQKSREYVAGQFSGYMKTVKGYESEVDPKYWVRVTDVNRARYQEMSRLSRIDLVRDGIYDKKMMSLLKKIRCQKDPTLAECSLGEE
ncbi:MAG: putative multidrug efflux protein AdeT1 [Aquirhabdus sp.]